MTATSGRTPATPNPQATPTVTYTMDDGAEATWFVKEDTATTVEALTTLLGQPSENTPTATPGTLTVPETVTLTHADGTETTWLVVQDQSETADTALTVLLGSPDSIRC